MRFIPLLTISLMLLLLTSPKKAQGLGVTDSLFNLLEATQNDSVKVNLLNDIAVHFYTRDYQEILHYAKQAEQLARHLGDEKNLSISLNSMGFAYWQMGNYETAMLYFRKAIDGNKDLKNKNVLADTYDYMGITYDQQGKDSLALAHLLMSLQIRENLGDKKKQAESFNNLCGFYWERQNFGEAMHYLQKKLTTDEELGNTEGMAMSYANFAANLYGIGNFDKALVYYNKSLKIYLEAGNKRHTATLYNNIGTLYTELGKYDEGIAYLSKALKLRKESNNRVGYAGTLQGMSEAVFASSNNYPKAIRQCKEALEIAKDLGAAHVVIATYQSMYNISKKSNHFEDALHYLELRNTIKDSITNETQRKQLTEMQVKYETQKKERKLQFMEQEKKILIQGNQLKEFRLYLLIAGIVLLLIASIFVVRKLRGSLKTAHDEKRQVEEELFFKNKELENFALRIVEKNEFLKELKSKLANLPKQPKNSVEIREISNAIKLNLYLDSDRRQLQMRIDQVHQTFISKLTKRFPKLTKSNKRLCSLLVLELSSKDIATILNITPASVKISRNRLRKALALDSHANIAQFLITL